MPWNQVFPTGPTLISQSVTPFQQNWSYLNTEIEQDHFFTTGVANGTHKWVNINDTGAPVRTSNSLLFSNTVGTGSKPYWANAGATFQIPFFRGTTAQGGIVGAGTWNIIDFSAAGLNLPATFYGFLTVAQNGGSLNQACAQISWDGTSARANFITRNAGGSITNIQAGATPGPDQTKIQIVTTGAMGIDWAFSIMYPG